MSANYFHLIILCIIVDKISLHECPKSQETYYSDTNLEQIQEEPDDTNEYIINTTTNLKIMDEVHEKMKFLALSGSLQDFMEKVLILGKYENLKLSTDDLQSFLLFVLDTKKMDDLYKVRDYWLKQLKKDELLKTRKELNNHILLKQDQVNAFLDESFIRCKEVLLKIKSKKIFYEMLDFYGKRDYPGVVCLCIFFFDGLKFQRENFSYEIFSEILFERLKKEEHYFGLPLKEVLSFEIDE